MRRRRPPVPPTIPPHLLTFDRADWPVLDDDEAADAWSAAGREWCASTGYSVVDFLAANRAARRRAQNAAKPFGGSAASS